MQGRVFQMRACLPRVESLTVSIRPPPDGAGKDGHCRQSKIKVAQPQSWTGKERFDKGFRSLPASAWPGDERKQFYRLILTPAK